MTPRQTQPLSFKTAAILGAGAWGTALALALSRAGINVRLWTWRSAHADAMAAQNQNAEHLSGHAFGDRIQPTASLGAASKTTSAPSSATSIDAVDGAEVVLLA